ncbi:MAG: class I SAM-dependent methyltransferase [Nitrospinota bacterium]|nr:class I SAM-dependent methyltransferase [Nitrospinota bacterium]
MDDFTRRAGQFDRKVKEKESAQFERAVHDSGFGPGHVAVDMGIGTGNAALPFLKAGGRVFGVELTPAMAQKGAKRLAEEGFAARALYTIAPAERAPIGCEAADAAVSRNVFHHFADPRAVFTEMAWTVRPGGHVFVIYFSIPRTRPRGKSSTGLNSFAYPLMFAPWR